MSTMRRTTALLAVAALVAACGGEETATETDDAAGGDVLSVVGTESLEFEPDEFAIPAGEQVTVELTAEGVEHDFVVEGAADVGQAEAADGHAHHGDDSGVPEEDLHVVHADAGGTQSATMSIDEPGTYTVYCDVPGHRAAGMEATLEVG